MTEMWKPIDSIDGLYEVSSIGSVRRLRHKSAGGKTLCEKNLSTRKNKALGYVVITLSVSGKNRAYYVHRLVAEAFLERPIGKNVVNHKDGDKSNNRIENLEWTDKSGNARHAIDSLGLDFHKAIAGRKGEDAGNSKLKLADVVEIKRLLSLGIRHSEIADLFGVGKSNISSISRGGTWSHV